MPKYKVIIEVVMYPRYEGRTLVIEAPNSDDAEARARVMVRNAEDNIDYIDNVRSVELDAN